MIKKLIYRNVIPQLDANQLRGIRYLVAGIGSKEWVGGCLIRSIGGRQGYQAVDRVVHLLDKKISRHAATHATVMDI